MRTQLMALALSSFAMACTAEDAVDDVGSSDESLTAPTRAKATIVDQTGTNIGVVELEKDGNYVEIEVEIYVASPGYHGFHLHGIGACSATFTSAGGHFNPSGATHGSHAGDLPSLLVNSDGTAETEFKTDRFTLDEILDADGAAFILHSAADNFGNVSTRYFSTTENVSGADSATKATGDAGTRIGCGVVKRTY